MEYINDFVKVLDQHGAHIAEYGKTDLSLYRSYVDVLILESGMAREFFPLNNLMDKIDEYHKEFSFDMQSLTISLREREQDRSDQSVQMFEMIEVDGELLPSMRFKGEPHACIKVNDSFLFSLDRNEYASIQEVVVRGKGQGIGEFYSELRKFKDPLCMNIDIDGLLRVSPIFNGPMLFLEENRIEQVDIRVFRMVLVGKLGSPRKVSVVYDFNTGLVKVTTVLGLLNLDHGIQVPLAAWKLTPEGDESCLGSLEKILTIYAPMDNERELGY